MTELKADVEIKGRAEGQILKLTKPISFWGGVDAKTGRIADPRHPEHDASITGKILVLPGMVGSSSASYVLTELMMEKRGPAALVIPEPDAILPLAIIVSREMGWGSIPVVRLPLAVAEEPLVAGGRLVVGDRPQHDLLAAGHVGGREVIEHFLDLVMLGNRMAGFGGRLGFAQHGRIERLLLRSSNGVID